MRTLTNTRNTVSISESNFYKAFDALSAAFTEDESISIQIEEIKSEGFGCNTVIFRVKVKGEGHLTPVFHSRSDSVTFVASDYEPGVSLFMMLNDKPSIRDARQTAEGLVELKKAYQNRFTQACQIARTLNPSAGTDKLMSVTDVLNMLHLAGIDIPLLLSDTAMWYGSEQGFINEVLDSMLSGNDLLALSAILEYPSYATATLALRLNNEEGVIAMLKRLEVIAQTSTKDSIHSAIGLIRGQLTEQILPEIEPEDIHLES